MSTWHGVMADGEEFMRWKIGTNTVYNTLKTDTKYSHSVRSRPTLKEVVGKESDKYHLFQGGLNLRNNALNARSQPASPRR